MDVRVFNNNVLRAAADLRQSWPSTLTPVFAPVMNDWTAIPARKNRERTQGPIQTSATEVEDFLRSGVADLTCVMNIAEVFRWNGGRVMEWGVGCGRMARHLHHTRQSKFIGTDVDPVNIDWCQKNMPFGTYELLDPYGRFSAPDASFDLIYSFSVMTHLSEPDQDHWLAELSRISKGLIILSVHGIVSAVQCANWAREPELVAKWLQTGYMDAVTANPDIADVTPPEYYRDTAHTATYIRQRWSQFVDVLDIIPGGFSGNHDAVVCRASRSEI